MRCKPVVPPYAILKYCHQEKLAKPLDTLMCGGHTQRAIIFILVTPLMNVPSEYGKPRLAEESPRLPTELLGAVHSYCCKGLSSHVVYIAVAEANTNIQN